MKLADLAERWEDAAAAEQQTFSPMTTAALERCPPELRAALKDLMVRMESVALETCARQLREFVEKCHCELAVTDEGLTVLNAFSGVGFPTATGFFGVAMRDNGVEVLHEGTYAWASSDGDTVQEALKLINDACGVIFDLQVVLQDDRASLANLKAADERAENWCRRAQEFDILHGAPQGCEGIAKRLQLSPEGQAKVDEVVEKVWATVPSLKKESEAVILRSMIADLSEDQFIAAFKNLGVDVECGACMSLFFCGFNGYSHTCEAHKLQFRKVESLPHECCYGMVVAGNQHSEDCTVVKLEATEKRLKVAEHMVHELQVDNTRLVERARAAEAELNLIKKSLKEGAGANSISREEALEQLRVPDLADLISAGTIAWNKAGERGEEQEQAVRANAAHIAELFFDLLATCFEGRDVRARAGNVRWERFTYVRARAAVMDYIRLAPLMTKRTSEQVGQKKEEEHG